MAISDQNLAEHVKVTQGYSVEDLPGLQRDITYGAGQTSALSTLTYTDDGNVSSIGFPAPELVAKVTVGTLGGHDMIVLPTYLDQAGNSTAKAVPGTTIDTCINKHANFTADTGITAASEATITIDGGALKLTYADATAFAGGEVVYDPITSADWSTYTYIAFWFRSDRTLTAGQFTWALSEATDLTTPRELDIPAVTADKWQYVVLDATGITAAQKDGVQSWGLVIQEDVPGGTGDVILYIENVIGLTTAQKAVVDTLVLPSGSVVGTEISIALDSGDTGVRNVTACSVLGGHDGAADDFDLLGR